VIPSLTTYAMGYRQTTGRAFSVAARRIAATFLGIRTTAGNVGISASKDNVVAVEPASTLLTTLNTVASAIKSVRVVINASLDIVGMLEFDQSSSKLYN
jgi:hypothetical protein